MEALVINLFTFTIISLGIVVAAVSVKELIKLIGTKTVKIKSVPVERALGALKHNVRYCHSNEIDLYNHVKTIRNKEIYINFLNTELYFNKKTGEVITLRDVLVALNPDKGYLAIDLLDSGLERVKFKEHADYVIDCLSKIKDNSTYDIHTGDLKFRVNLKTHKLVL